MKLPLTYTAADLEDILTPGTYRLDLVDHRGEPLGPTVQITVGNLRNGAEDESSAEENEPVAAVPALTANALPPGTNDTRLVLEANIRATQLAFQHTQRTLELGLRAAETLREGVQVLVEAQADVMKSMSSARGFFRNAAPPPQLPPPEPPRREADPKDESDDEDDEQEPPAPAQPAWMEAVVPLVVMVTQQIVTMVMSMKSGNSDGGGFKLKDMLDWSQPAKRKAAAEQAALQSGERRDAEAPASPAPSVQAQLADPATGQHFFAILAALSLEERAVAGKLVAELSEAERAGWLKELKQLSVEDAVKKVREIVSSLIKKPAA